MQYLASPTHHSLLTYSTLIHFIMFVAEYLEFIPTKTVFPWSKDPLPPGWKMSQCPDTGRLYFLKYVNVASVLALSERVGDMHGDNAACFQNIFP